MGIYFPLWVISYITLLQVCSWELFGSCVHSVYTHPCSCFCLFDWFVVVVVFCFFVCLLLFFFFFLAVLNFLSASRLIFSISCPSLGISHFSKEPWFLLLKIHIRNQHLGSGSAFCYWSVIGFNACNILLSSWQFYTVSMGWVHQGDSFGLDWIQPVSAGLVHLSMVIGWVVTSLYDRLDWNSWYGCDLFLHDLVSFSMNLFIWWQDSIAARRKNAQFSWDLRWKLTQ